MSCDRDNTAARRARRDGRSVAQQETCEIALARRYGEAGHQLDQIGLAFGAGLLKQTAQMGLGRRFGDAERRRDLRYSVRLEQGE